MTVGRCMIAGEISAVMEEFVILIDKAVTGIYSCDTMIGLYTPFHAHTVLMSNSRFRDCTLVKKRYNCWKKMNTGQAGFFCAIFTTSRESTIILKLNKQTAILLLVLSSESLNNSPCSTAVVLQLLLLKNHFCCIKHADPQTTAPEVLKSWRAEEAEVCVFQELSR